MTRIAEQQDQTCQVCLEFGRKTLQRDQLGRLRAGEVIDLDAFVDDYVDVYADGKLIARGRPVVVDGKLGVRIQESTGTVSARPAREKAPTR